MCGSFCIAILSVVSSFAITPLRERERERKRERGRAALLNLCDCCAVAVRVICPLPHGAVVGLQYMIGPYM